MNNICIIPARGGSKRLPRKNVMDFHGKPILLHSVEAAIESGCFDQVVVSSEDKEILDLVSHLAVECHQRDLSLATDDATVAKVCMAILNDNQFVDDTYHRLCVLYATAPLRNAEDIASVMSLLDHPECDYAIAATRFSHYPHQALMIERDQFVTPKWPELACLRSSVVGEFVAGNGSTYAVDISVFKKSGVFYGPGMRYHLMPFSRSIDIDTLEDWRIAEKMYELTEIAG